MDGKSFGLPKLTGIELLNKVSELGEAPKKEIAKCCGYYKKTANGNESIDFAGFYEAILVASGLTAAEDNLSCDGPDETLIDILKDGVALLKLPFDSKLIHEKNAALIEQQEWDPFYPGHPMQVSIVNRSPGESAFIEDQEIEFDPNGSIVLRSKSFIRGDRYCLEVESEEDLTFQLEPMPWNGIDASYTENLRLLILPRHSVCDLLMLCHEDQEDLYDIDNFESFEANLGYALEKAISGLHTKEASEFLSLFGYAKEDIRTLIEKNWQEQELLRDKEKIRTTIDEFLG